MGVTQYTFSAEQEERVMSSATIGMNNAGCTIMCCNNYRREDWYNKHDNFESYVKSLFAKSSILSKCGH